jgi:hypothetical protein
MKPHNKIITTNFFIEKGYLYTLVWLTILATVFGYRHLPANTKALVGILLACLYLVFLIWTLFYFLIRTVHIVDLNKEIEYLEYYKTSHPYDISIDEKAELNLLKKVSETITSPKKYVHALKTKEEIIVKSNWSKHALILILLFFCQYYFDVLKPFGPILFTIITIICIVFCLKIINWDIFQIKRGDTSIGYAIILFLLFTFGKASFTRNFGDEIIGDFFQKPDYVSKYYVNVFPENDKIKNYRVPDDIHVCSPTEIDGMNNELINENIFACQSKYIVLQTIYWTDGDQINFYDADHFTVNCSEEPKLTVGTKVYCIDSNDKEWDIELTKEKVK